MHCKLTKPKGMKVPSIEALLVSGLPKDVTHRVVNGKGTKPLTLVVYYSDEGGDVLREVIGNGPILSYLNKFCEGSSDG